MLPFSLCAGGRLGDGKQLMSWIALPDVLRILTRLIEEPALLTAHTDPKGACALNLVAGKPITNADFTKALGRAIRRPTPFPLPKSLIRLLFGEMGDALLLGHSSVISQRLPNLGIALQYPNIDLALAYLVKNKA
jgi:NAD dependent epimerase/dehydratase family enzyme